MSKQTVTSDLVLKVLGYVVISLFALAAVIPLIMIFAVSFSEEKTVILHGYKLWPEVFSLATYEYVFKSGTQWFIQSYFISVAVTAAGTLSSLLVTSMLAYSLSLKTLKYRNVISFFAYFTILFGGGLVPWYIVCVNYYHLANTFWVLFLPYLVSVWLLLILRTFFMTVPDSLIESAKIDGAHDFYIYLRIMVPVSQTAMVTVGLFYALQYWNDWFLPLIFVTDTDLYGMQIRLYNILSNAQNLIQSGSSAAAAVRVPSETIKMATTVLTVTPIILLFPFIQKYFIKGMTVGAVKG